MDRTIPKRAYMKLTNFGVASRWYTTALDSIMVTIDEERSWPSARGKSRHKVRGIDAAV